MSIRYGQKKQKKQRAGTEQAPTNGTESGITDQQIQKQAPKSLFFC